VSLLGRFDDGSPESKFLSVATAREVEQFVLDKTRDRTVDIVGLVAGHGPTILSSGYLEVGSHFEGGVLQVPVVRISDPGGEYFRAKEDRRSRPGHLVVFR